MTHGPPTAIMDYTHSGDAHPLNWGSQTLFVNAAIEGENPSMQLPWVAPKEQETQAAGRSEVCK